MKRTISMMIGKGSVKHNSRAFHAQNTDPQRSYLNRCYCNEPIREIYHQLFDDAVALYNDKQTRNDRTISDYYEKIRSGKQEKLFHEVIFQVGNKDDMGAETENSELAARILDDFMADFQKRNPNLHVFSAYLHMDEATPHLHIDFVPFTTGSKRGLDTRVSLKQALSAQGFTGGTRGDTEWSQWVRSEKEQLSQVMERHDLQWEQLGTHDEHLSVVNFKKEQRTKEVAGLDEAISDKKDEFQQLAEETLVQQSAFEKYSAKLESVQDKLKAAKIKEKFVYENARRYDDDPEYLLPEPKPLMSAKVYHEKIAMPLVVKLKKVIRSILLQFFDKTRELKTALEHANDQVQGLLTRLQGYEAELSTLRETERNYQYLRRGVGEDIAEKVIREVKAKEIALKQPKRIIRRDYLK